MAFVLSRRGYPLMIWIEVVAGGTEFLIDTQSRVTLSRSEKWMSHIAASILAYLVLQVAWLFTFIFPFLLRIWRFYALELIENDLVILVDLLQVLDTIAEVESACTSTHAEWSAAVVTPICSRLAPYIIHQLRVIRKHSTFLINH